MHSAQRTLVKSAPELWGELSDPDGLARRLAHFGEVRTTGLEPEDTVAWEGDRVRGTVRLEPSGWGTKVTLEVEPAEGPEEPEVVAVAEPEPDPEPEAEPVALEPEPEPEPEAEPEPAPRRRLFARLFGRRAHVPGPPPPPSPDPSPPAPAPDPSPPTPTPEPGPPPPPDPSPPQIGLDPEETVAALEAVLDDLGSAHHRPFSRA